MGALLLAGYYVPLALILLAPVTVNILLYHVFVDPAGLGMAVFVVAANAFLGWAYLSAYSGVLAAKTDLNQTKED